MDIAELSMSLNQNRIMSAVGTAMLGKTLDLVEGQADMMTDTMGSMNTPSLESLVYPTSGTQIDMRI
ncbi:MAG: YjfB family protein [Pseudobutyrivibrio sp.]|nr:YjfB family protein [Pseudobutyrivibrio sp.]